MKNILVFTATLFFAHSAFAGEEPIITVPVLDNWGLVAMSAVLGVVGLLALIRK